METEFSELPIDPSFDIRNCPGYLKVLPDLVSLQYAFSVINGQAPSLKEFSNVDTEAYLEWLQKSPVKKTNYFTRTSYGKGKKKNRVYKFYVFICIDFIIWNENNNLLMIYHPVKHSQKVIPMTRIIEEKFRRNELGNCIYYLDDVLLFANHKILYLNDLPVDPEVHYNDDFSPINENITGALNSGIKDGFIILTGEPGNGKSTYLKYLTRICHCRFLYLSKWTSQWIDISNFEWLKESYNNAVLILEDVDELLEHNALNKGSLVRFLKGVVKGRFSKGIFFPVIITINRSINEFPAISESESEHLIAFYDFKPLEEVKARKLAESLGRRMEISGPVSLHDIYNHLPVDEQI